MAGCPQEGQRAANMWLRGSKCCPVVGFRSARPAVGGGIGHVGVFATVS